MYRPATTSIHPMYGYPKIGQPTGHSLIPPAAGRTHQPPSPTSSSPGIGIRVALKPEYLITPPPPQLSPQIGDIPRSNFQFNFDFERKILTEAEKENPNWSRLGLENLPSKATETSSLVRGAGKRYGLKLSVVGIYAYSGRSSGEFFYWRNVTLSGSTTDLVVRKYIASGLSREAVPLAVANYGDNPTKVREFSSGYTLLREMGFSSNSVAEALLMYDNDTDKALAHFLNNSS